MAITLTVSVDSTKAEQLRSELAGIKNGFPRAVTLGVNKTARTANTKIIRTISEEINIKPSELRARNIKLTLANYDTLTAKINVTGRRIPLSHFSPSPSEMNPARQRRVSGTSWIINRGARTSVAGAFTAQMASGHLGVFRRKGNARLGIMELFGPSVPQVMENTEELAQGVLDKEIEANLERNVDFFVAQTLEGRTPSDGGGEE